MFPIPFMLIGKVVGCTVLSFATHQVLRKVFIPAPAASGVLPDEVRQEIEAGKKFMKDTNEEMVKIKEGQCRTSEEMAVIANNVDNLTNRVYDLAVKVKTIEEHNNNAKGFLEELRRRTERSW